jgi:O-antigen/teichoic acid export membrane protein
MPFLIGPVILLIPVLIPLLLPKYLEGIIPTQINVLGSYFLSLAYVARGILIANHWQMRALVISSIVLVINLSLCIFLLKLGLGLNGVALGSSISCVLFFIGLLSFIRRNCRYALEEWRSNLIGICWPFPIMMSSLLLLNYSFQWIPITEPIAAFIKVLLFYSILLFMLKFAQKRFVHLKGLTLERLWQL